MLTKGLKIVAVASIVVCVFLIHGAIKAQPIYSIPSTIMAGIGSPTSNGLTCGVGQSGPSSSLLYNQRDVTTGNSIWKCGLATDGVTYAWQSPFSSPVLQIATTGSITGGSFILGGCTAVTTITMTGANPTANAADANPIFASAPSGALGLFSVKAWVSATNTVSVQGCATGVIGSVPNFTAKVFLY